ncbi:pectinesterase inhibitor 3-like [Bidens hawaiensis]|uniref:pectinesterase inhibitor 3-like n=1 Tax=Bidens hawaiensis TaxID=980011 RepID=UPI00404A7543
MAYPSLDLVQSSCMHATFPKVCNHTLSIYNGPVTTPHELALAAIRVSISQATKTSIYLLGIRKETDQREKGVVNDCASQIADSVDDLRKTLGELKELRRGTFRWQMSNAETWVSAALTDEDTCLDECSIKEGIKARLGTKRTGWVDELPHVLWAFRNQKNSSNSETSFSLTYGTEAMIPAENRDPIREGSVNQR